MTYEQLLLRSEKEGIIVKEKNLRGNDGRIKGNRIALRRAMPTIKKACVLAEELGHYYTTSGNILDQSDTNNRKQELRARLWAYNCQIGLCGIIQAYKHGCQNLHDTADFLDVTENFLMDALEQYHRHYGICAPVDNYVIFFEPALIVMEKISD